MSRLTALGVVGKNLPSRASRTVAASDFSTAALIGHFERKYKKAFKVTGIAEAQKIFGQNISSSWYGSDCVDGFFRNLNGVDAGLYIKSHVGHTGSAFDAVCATLNAVDTQVSAKDVLKIDSAYQTELDYGVSGNRTGFTITNGARFTTALATTSAATDTWVACDSVAGFAVGDIIKINDGTPIYRKITSITEATKRLNFTAQIGAIVTAAVAITAMGFQLKTWRKDINGLVTEVDTNLGQIWCTTEPEVTNFYAPNVFAASTWINVTRLTTTPANIEMTLPATVATVTYLAAGADGTTATTAAMWAPDLTALDTLRVRWIMNPETSTVLIQQAIETYCKARTDTPIAMINVPSGRTKDQLVVLGQGYQRSDDVMAVVMGDWYKIVDPFTTAINAQLRSIPCVAHVTANWIRTIASKGIHCIPTKEFPIQGIADVDNATLGVLSNVNRTDVANAGVNITQYLAGIGAVVRNLFTPSTATSYQFANGILMRNYIKVSIEDSLQLSENTPNSINQIDQDRVACFSFMQKLWSKGSNGAVPEGETFGQYMKDDGSLSKASDHFIVQADAINNTRTTINNGERHIDTWFTYATPAGLIDIGVGILLIV